MKKYIILVITIILMPLAYAHESCNATISQNNTIEVLPEGYCNISLGLETDKTGYNNGEKVIINNKLSNKTYNFTIDYWIEYLNGSILKEKITTSNTNNKQYTPKLTENTTLIVKNNLSHINCINVNNNTENEVKIFVSVEKDSNPNITIEKLYLNRSKKIEIGNNLTSLIAVYTGDNDNYTIYGLIENITNNTNYTITGKFNFTRFNITTNIPYNCNIETGDYTLIIKSKYLESKQNFTIVNNCENSMNNVENENHTIVEDHAENNINESNSSESIINLAENQLTGKIIYESTNIKAKKFASYLFMVILAAIAIITLTKNKNTNETLKESTEKWSSQLEQ